MANVRVRRGRRTRSSFEQYFTHHISILEPSRLTGIYITIFTLISTTYFLQLNIKKIEFNYPLDLTNFHMVLYYRRASRRHLKGSTAMSATPSKEQWFAHGSRITTAKSFLRSIQSWISILYQKPGSGNRKFKKKSS